ncbi:endonuclease/exonuclease/phosphatase family protein [Myxococcota bacterium]|nr:endonuclease/exonuclease/phosphatase family protein [Myxococcota bacterium]
MPYYYPLLKQPKAERVHTIEGLSRLRAGFEGPLNHDIRPIPPRDLHKHLLLATWNIREFDSGKGGERLLESIYYIAEIIDRFDLVAVQEVRDDLLALERLMNALGKHWAYICTDVTLGSAGNGERMAFLYDRRKVSFAGVAGELVVPEKLSALQFARTPFVTSWKAGWADFTLCTVHMYYGSASADDPRRLEEIRKLVELLGKRTKKHQVERAGKRVEIKGENIVLLGDFNIFGRSDAGMTALRDGGVFQVPEALQDVPGSNVDKNKHYDQIACGQYQHRFMPTGKAGVFDFYDYVFRAEDEPRFTALLGKNSYREWRTHQLSDHLVMWQQFKIDFSDEYLGELSARD